MAGMLPGVEVARRRRFHQSGGFFHSPRASSAHSSARRFPLCAIYESHLSSTSSMQRGPISQANCYQKLNDAAREAKQRLDGKLRTSWISDSKRVFSRQQGSGQSENRPMEVRELQTEAHGLKKSGSKRFGWQKLSWKSSEQKECAVCLEQLKRGENLMQLACAHRFHSRCLAPWLENNAHCPCCRMELV